MKELLLNVNLMRLCQKLLAVLLRQIQLRLLLVRYAVGPLLFANYLPDFQLHRSAQ